MNIKVKLDEGAFMPTKAHEADAGFDIRTPKKVYVSPGCSVVINTGVHVAIPEGYGGLLVAKSGLNVRDGILSDGLIDSGYTGSIAVKLYNHGAYKKVFEVGDKVTQLVIFPIPACKMVEADSLEETERGDNGFGSSGR